MLMLGSSATGNVNLCAVTNGATSFESASTDTATSVKPSSRCWRYSRSIAGISSRHGGHHVAQKLISTTCPRWSRSRTLPLPGVFSEKSSARLERAGLMSSSSRMASGSGSTRPARALAAGATVAFAGADAETVAAGAGLAASPGGRCSPANSPTAAATATRVSAITMASSGRIESCAVYL